MSQTTVSVRRADDAVGKPRRLFMILSPHSLSYASLALSSLFGNCDEPFELTLITDSEDDKNILIDRLSTLSASCGVDEHAAAVFSYSDFDGRETDRFSQYPNLRSFRGGHPCWRKITDPVLLSDEGQEMIILDPDIYFPNRFRFEPTPDSGLLLMWQKPSCLMPPKVVENAIRNGIRLAHHTDIGVAQWKMPVDLAWLDWLLGTLGDPDLPRNMHVESIVWAAIAMRIGGGYLDPLTWRCWNRSQFKRILKRLGAGGAFMLGLEPWAELKCFHAGGEAKWWLAATAELGKLDGNATLIDARGWLPFTELTPVDFMKIERRRRWLRKLGYYSLLP